MEEDAMEKLTDIGAKASLRYSVQLLSLAAQNARASKQEKVKVKDVKRVNSLFMDIGEAAEHLKKIRRETHASLKNSANGSKRF